MIIQRPQNLYFLLCAGLCMTALSRFVPVPFAWEPCVLLMMAAGVLAAISVFLFKLLKVQALMARVIQILILIVFVLIIYDLLNLSGGAAAPEKGIEVWGLLSLFLALVMAVMARKGVKKDLSLVKSAGRLR